MKNEFYREDNNDSRPILVIDDEQIICQFFSDLFEEYGINIDVEQTGKSGLARALSDKYTLIFLDVKLGDMNGIDVLKELKELNPETKVVMISGYLTEELIEKALKLGVDGYLYKPLSVRDILSITLRFIDTKQLLKSKIISSI